MRVLRLFTAVFACVALVACGRQSTPNSPASISPTFGVLARSPDAAGQSPLGDCLNQSGSAVCFTASVSTGGLRFMNDAASQRMRAAVASGAADEVAPEPPTNLTGSVTRGVSSSTVFLSWRAPATGVTPTTYRIDAGSAAGQTDQASFLTGSNATSFSTTVSGTGTFYVRIRAVAGTAVSLPSNEIVLSLIDPALPGAPVLSRPTITGSTVTLSWTRPFTGGAPTSYIIQASSTAGGPANLANFATGNTATTITASGVAAGTYFVRVLAANNSGIGPASSEVSFIVVDPNSCSVAPPAPSNLVALVNGSTVTLGWSPSTGPVTSYVIEAGSGSGRADLAVADTGSTSGIATFNGVAAGTYYVRVRGRNACGLSPVSNETQVVVR
jgi:hypothetical protein